MLDRYGTLAFIDLETTGTDPETDAITEIGIVHVNASGVTRWSTLINPQKQIPSFIQRLTGITDAMVATAPTFSSVAPELIARLQGSLFIAHNARFDYGFLRNALRRLDLRLQADVLCTVKLSRKLFPTERHHNLDALISRHQLTIDQRHRALPDAELLWQFWSTLERTVPADVLREKIEHLLQKPKLPSCLPPELLDDMPDKPGVYIFYDERDAALHIGNSSRLRTRVLAHFSAENESRRDAQLAQNMRRIDWRETGGEVAAQLLEAQLIKSLRPAYRNLRDEDDQLQAWRLVDTAGGHAELRLVHADECDFGRTDNLYGLFHSSAKALAALRALARAHELCSLLTGLEEREGVSHACRAWQIGGCLGACVGEESRARHRQRLLLALTPLKLRPWPYGGAAVLNEMKERSKQEIIVVDNWNFLGLAHSDAEVWQLLEEAPSRPTFNADVYKILSRALADGKLRVRPLSTRAAWKSP